MKSERIVASHKMDLESNASLVESKGNAECWFGRSLFSTLQARRAGLGALLG